MENIRMKLPVLENLVLKSVVLESRKNLPNGVFVEFEICPGLGISFTAYIEDRRVVYLGRPVSYEDSSLTDLWDEDFVKTYSLNELVIQVWDHFGLQEYGDVYTLIEDSVLVKSSDNLYESRKRRPHRLHEDQITRKQKEKLNLLNDIVNFAYEYGENETKTLFKQAFKRVTGDDLVDSLTDE